MISIDKVLVSITKDALILWNGFTIEFYSFNKLSKINNWNSDKFFVNSSIIKISIWGQTIDKYPPIFVFCAMLLRISLSTNYMESFWIKNNTDKTAKPIWLSQNKIKSKMNKVSKYVKKFHKNKKAKKKVEHTFK